MTSKTRVKKGKSKTRDILRREIEEDLLSTAEKTNQIQVIGSENGRGRTKISSAVSIALT